MNEAQQLQKELALHQMRIKIKSLADESRAIRREVSKVRKGESRNFIRESLYLHRVGIVRTEARATLLAYAHARGIPYTAVEAAGSSRPNYADVQRNLKRFRLDDTAMTAWFAGELENQAA